MESIRFFSGHNPLSNKAKATPVGEEIRVYMDGPEVCALMGDDIPNHIAVGFAESLAMAIGNLAAELDEIESDYPWMMEGPAIAAFMSENGPQAQGRTPIDALINLAKNILGYAGWEPDLE